MKIFKEIHRRSLWQILGIYLAGGWVALQAVEVVAQSTGLPSWIQPFAMVLLIIGLPIVLATAFVQEGIGKPRPTVRPFADPGSEATPSPATGAPQAGPAGSQPEAAPPPPTADGVHHRLFTWRNALVGGGAAFLLMFGFAGLYVVIQDRGESFAPPEAVASDDAAPGIAVLPFEVSGAGMEEWREGMVNLLSTNLDGAGGLRAIDSRTVLAQWDEEVGAQARADQATSLGLAREIGGVYGVLGAATAIGPQVRLTADVYETGSGELLGQAQAEGSPDDVLGLVDELSIGVLRLILGGESEQIPAFDLAAVTTHSVPALKAYLEGAAFFRRAEWEEATEALDRAVAIDSTFSAAYSLLGSAWGWRTNSNHPNTVSNREKAFALIDHLPEREALMLRIRHAFATGDTAGVGLGQRTVRRYPDDAEAWYELGELYFHLRGRALATLEETDEAFLRAIDLDPGFAPYWIHPTEFAFTIGDSAIAADRVAAYGRLVDEDDLFRRRGELRVDLTFGDSATRAAAIAGLDTVATDVLGGSGVAVFRSGPHREVSAIALRELEQRGELSSGMSFQAVQTAIAGGELQEALDLIDSDDAPGFFICLGVVWLVGGLPVPADRIDPLTRPAAVDSTDFNDTACSGWYAATQGRWDDFRTIRAMVERRRDREEAAGDTAAASRSETELDILEASELRARGRGEEAIEPLVAAFVATAFPTQVVGDLYTELGRHKEAARYYEADWVDPFVRFKLARAYEELGRPDDAQEAYEYFVASWTDPDPELQPFVDEAIAALARLTDRLSVEGAP